MLNKVILLGRLVKEPTTATTKDGKIYCHFSIATNLNPNSTLYIDCTTWNASADFLEKFGFKGARVLIDGQLVPNNFKTKDGKEVNKIEALAFNVHILDKKQEKSVEEKPAENMILPF